MGRLRFDGALSDARHLAGPEEGRLPQGFWFGSDLRTCWRSVYESFSLERLRQEEDELWAERERLAVNASADEGALEPVLLRIALVEDRLREIIGRYS